MPKPRSVDVEDARDLGVGLEEGASEGDPPAAKGRSWDGLIAAVEVPVAAGGGGDGGDVGDGVIAAAGEKCTHDERESGESGADGFHKFKWER